MKAPTHPEAEHDKKLMKLYSLADQFDLEIISAYNYEEEHRHYTVRRWQPDEKEVVFSSGKFTTLEELEAFFRGYRAGALDQFYGRVSCRL